MLTRLAIVISISLTVSVAAGEPPRVTLIQSSPLAQLPEPPVEVTAARLFSRAQDILAFQSALLRYLQTRQGKMDQALYEKADAHLTASASQLEAEVSRLIPLASKSHRPYLLHLRAWLLFRGVEARLWSESTTDKQLADFVAPTRETLERIVDDFQSYPHRWVAALQSAYLLRETGHAREALLLAQSTACPQGMTAGSSNPYQDCDNPTLDSIHKTYLWMHLIGSEHAQSSASAELELATYAYQKAIAAGGELAGFARYHLGWSYYRLDRWEDAIAAFVALLETGDTHLRSETIAFLAHSIVEAWQQQPEGISLLSSTQRRFAGRYQKPYVRLTFRELVQLTKALEMHTESAAFATFVQETWPPR